MARIAKTKLLTTPGNSDSLDFLLSVQNDPKAPAELRIRAAIAAAPYQHTKQGNRGLKVQRKDRAEVVSGGRFKPAEAPPLNGRDKVK
jgi:hypothetical protein